MIYMYRWAILLLLVVLAPGVTAAPPRPPAAAVASAHPLATEAAFETLRAGGNAFDAAVTVAATLSVVEPHGSGLGGGGFFLLHRAADRHDVMIDARERAPLAARADMYLDKRGEPRPRASLDGVLAAGIPGTPAGLVHLAERYGRLPLAKSLAPAVRRAREGFPVTGHFLKMARLRLHTLLDSGEASLLFLDDGALPRPGQIIRQPELAETLTRLARAGREGFYAGETARRLVDGVRDAGGIWSLEDLKQYRVVERAPLRFQYRGMRVTTVALPSAGGLLLAKMLRTLDRDVPAAATLEGRRAIIEAMRAAYRERGRLGDSDYVSVDTSVFLEDVKATTAPAAIGERERGANTTHFSVLDRDGNRVAATLSLNLPFGSGFMVPGTGVLLNNQMDDFAIKPGAVNVYGLTGSVANAIAPGKRPLSSMTPTFLETGDALAVLGTPGGSRIPGMVLLATLAFEQGVRDPAALVGRARYHHQDTPNRLDYEDGAFNETERFRLDEWGYRLEVRTDGYGNMQAVVWDKLKKQVRAAADPRGEGRARTE
jgi:gamma-glutamyltranspeptidase/glutathione hydrolase